MKRWITKRAARFHRTPQSMRAFYNRIHWMYWVVEHHLRPGVEEVLASLSNDPGFETSDTALEYACGSGVLTRQLAPLFQKVTGRDLSPKMLERAKRQVHAANITFEAGNIHDVPDGDNTFDYVFISFGLHLFSPEDQKKILSRLLQVARKEVIIIEHIPQWQWYVALIEWWEGSHYTEFINTNWREVANGMDARFSREITGGCQVQRWRQK